MDTGSEGLGQTGGRAFAFIGPVLPPRGGPAAERLVRSARMLRGEMQKDGEVGGASRAPTAAVGGQPSARGPDGRSRQRSRGPKGGAPGERPDCAYASATDVRCIPHRGWRVPET